MNTIIIILESLAIKVWYVFTHKQKFNFYEDSRKDSKARKFQAAIVCQTSFLQGTATIG